MYLLPEKPTTYNEALGEARAKDLVKKNNTGLQLPADIMKTLAISANKWSTQLDYAPKKRTQNQSVQHNN